MTTPNPRRDTWLVVAYLAVTLAWWAYATWLAAHTKLLP